MKLNCAEFTRLYDKTNTGDRILLDVRNRDEVSEGALPGHVNIPLPELESRAGELSKDKHIFIHCRSGGRAQKAYDILVAKGFTKLLCAVEGGFSDLKGAIK